MHRAVSDAYMYSPVIYTMQGCRSQGGKRARAARGAREARGPWHPQILADQLTLAYFNKGGRLCPPHYHSPAPGYFQTFLRPSYVPSAKDLHMLELNVAKLAPIFFVKTYQNLSLKVKDCHEL